MFFFCCSCFCLDVFNLSAKCKPCALCLQVLKPIQLALLKYVRFLLPPFLSTQIVRFLVQVWVISPVSRLFLSVLVCSFNHHYPCVRVRCWLEFSVWLVLIMAFFLIVGELRSMFLISSTWHGLTTSSDRARLTICHICILSPKCLIDCDWTKKRSPSRYPRFVLCSFPYIKWFFFLSIIAQKCVNIFPVRQAKSKAKMFINMIWLKYLVLTE